MAPVAGRDERSKRILRRSVIEAEHDDALGVAHELAGIGPPLEGLGHPGHVAMRAFREPGGETLARMRGRVGGRDPAGVEAEGERFFA